MTPKEKAIELVNKYINLYPSYIVMFQGDIDEATKNIKKCALIAVNEIIKSQYKVLSGVKPSFYDYWAEVELEIEKL